MVDCIREVDIYSSKVARWCSQCLWIVCILVVVALLQVKLPDAVSGVRVTLLSWRQIQSCVRKRLNETFKPSLLGDARLPEQFVLKQLKGETERFLSVSLTYTVTMRQLAECLSVRRDAAVLNVTRMWMEASRAAFWSCFLIIVNHSDLSPINLVLVGREKDGIANGAREARGEEAGKKRRRQRKTMKDERHKHTKTTRKDSLIWTSTETTIIYLKTFIKKETWRMFN